jgi:hypothetical protein
VGVAASVTAWDTAGQAAVASHPLQDVVITMHVMVAMATTSTTPSGHNAKFVLSRVTQLRGAGTVMTKTMFLSKGTPQWQQQHPMGWTRTRTQTAVPQIT